VALYWNASCLKEIGSPRFWPKENLEPKLAQYEKAHPEPPQRPTPICNAQLTQPMSAFGGKADIPRPQHNVH
jgi:hypothetical protein